MGKAGGYGLNNAVKMNIQFKTAKRKSFTLKQIACLWNSLPQVVMVAANLKKFKKCKHGEQSFLWHHILALFSNTAWFPKQLLKNTSEKGDVLLEFPSASSWLLWKQHAKPDKTHQFFEVKTKLMTDSATYFPAVKSHIIIFICPFLQYT